MTAKRKPTYSDPYIEYQPNYNHNEAVELAKKLGINIETGLPHKTDRKYADRSESAATKKQVPKTNTVIRNLRVIPKQNRKHMPCKFLCDCDAFHPNPDICRPCFH